MELHESEGYSIAAMCKEAGVSRAAYYKWLNSIPSQKEIDDRNLAVLVDSLHYRYKGILGYRTMTLYVNRLYNKDCKPKRIRRIMKILGIHSAIRLKRENCTVRNPKDQAVDNVLDRDFEASAPNMKWATDVTEFKIPGTSKKLYLSAIIDLYDRSIVSFVIGPNNNNRLVFDTLKKALEANPNAHPILHSDRGFQYTCPEFKKMLKQYGMIQSMSRVGSCLDNAPTEGFWGILKVEMNQMYKIFGEESLRTAIQAYVNFYNNDRLQARYEGKTPNEVRQEALYSESPKQYPIPYNPRIQKYKAQFYAV